MADSTLLLADDSVTIQKVVNLTFSGEGIDVVTVGEGNSAMDVLRENQPDLVMVDVNLPGINGYEICERVRSMDAGREIPVILLVGSFEPFDADEAQRVGATAHLTKPFESIAILVDMVQGYLGRDSGTPRFDETVEYPTDADIVVSESSIPFVGGFEDETIEAEQVSPAPVPETEYDTFEESYVAESPEQEEGEAESADEMAYGAGVGETARFTPVEEDEVEGSAEAPEQYDSEAHEVEWEVESEVEEVVEETYYRKEMYRESSLLNSTDEFEPYDYNQQEPVRGIDSESGYEEAEEAGHGNTEEMRDPAATVRLDEADLLELPVDPGLPPAETEEPEIELMPAPESEERARIHRPLAFIDHPGVEPDPAPEPVIESAEQDLEQTVRETVHETGEERGFTGEIPEEVIDEIARRVIAKLSDRAVREIAWEVVPEMAEMIIRKMTEQKLNE